MPVAEWRVRGRTLSTADGTLIMGVVNVTPDSFSDGGAFLDPARAVRHGLDLVAAGAHLVDVGGESTRPGAGPVPVAEERSRVVPVIAELAAAGVVVSVDTAKPEVAAAAIDAGAAVVNDVTALADPEMARLAAAAGVGVVLMHMQGTPRTMQDEPRYDDVVAEVTEFLVGRAAAAVAAGVAREAVCIDPGIGFGKTSEHNLALLAGLAALTGTGYPVMVGASRKSFLGTLLGGLPPRDRDEATAAVSALAAAAGAAVIRVHEVARTAVAVRVANAIVRASTAGE